MPEVRAKAELLHDQAYRECVIEVIKAELAESHLLGPRASCLVRDPEKFFVVATSSRTIRHISETTKCRINLAASVCYIIEAGIVASVIPLSPVTRDEVRMLESLPDTHMSVDPRLNPPRDLLLREMGKRPRMESLLRPRDYFDLKIFVVDEGMRGAECTRDTDGWMDRFMRAPQRRVLYDPFVHVSLLELFAADEVMPASAPPVLDWDALRGQSLPGAALDWWNRFCKEVRGLTRATLVALPTYARAVLEVLRGSEHEEWRSKPHLLRPGTLMKLRPRRQDEEWLRWEFFVRMK
jgi:hypothetical protein